MAFIQEGNWIQLTTPLGENKLLLERLEGEEHLSGLFRFTLELLSEDDALDSTQIVGKNLTVTFGLPGLALSVRQRHCGPIRSGGKIRAIHHLLR